MNKRIKKKNAIRKCKEGIKRSVLLFYDLGPEAIDGLELMYTYRMGAYQTRGQRFTTAPVKMAHTPKAAAGSAGDYSTLRKADNRRSICHALGASPGIVTHCRRDRTGEATLPLRCLAAATPL